MKNPYLILTFISTVLIMCYANAEDKMNMICKSDKHIVIHVQISSCNNIDEIKRFNKNPQYYPYEQTCFQSIVRFYNYKMASFEEPLYLIFDTYINGKKIIGHFRPDSLPIWIDKLDNSFVCSQVQD